MVIPTIEIKAFFQPSPHDEPLCSPFNIMPNTAYQKRRNELNNLNLLLNYVDMCHYATTKAKKPSNMFFETLRTGLSLAIKPVERLLYFVHKQLLDSITRTKRE
jgi:hypothetical protein